jgi:hypothetical protein
MKLTVCHRINKNNQLYGTLGSTVRQSRGEVCAEGGVGRGDVCPYSRADFTGRVKKGASTTAGWTKTIMWDLLVLKRSNKVPHSSPASVTRGSPF